MQQILVIILSATLSLFGTMLNARENTLGAKNDYILILNSYGYENTWSTELSKLIRYEIEEQEPNVIVSISYAGITNRSSFISGRFGMQAAFANGRVSKEVVTPTVLILIGDESWMYYRIMNLRGIWDKVPVLLVGVHSEIMDDFSNFHTSRTIQDSLMIPLENSKKSLPMTALVNKDNEAYTVWLMKQLMPDLEQIVFLSTGGYQDEYALALIQSVISIQYPELKLNVINVDGKNAEAVIQKDLLVLPLNSAILIGSAEMPRNVNVPVFQLNDRNLEGKIAVGGYYPLKKDYAHEAADIALRIHRGESPDSISFTFVSGEVPQLNKTAIEYFDFDKAASTIPDVAYINIPAPFFQKYMRHLLLLSLTGIILITIFLLNRRGKRHRKYLLQSMEKYKKIYDEYQIVYENMPMGLAFFDKKGNLLNRNQSSDLFFDKIPENQLTNFNFFESELIDKSSKMKISKKLLVNKVFEYNDRSLRLIFRYIQDEKTESEDILMIILDYTTIQKEKAAKERIYDIFNFAMNASSLGVAEYNLIDKSRFATDAWYKNLCIDESVDASNVYQALVEEDRKKIKYFLNHIGEDGEVYFNDTVRVQEGEKVHWLHYVIQLLEYGPEEGRIIVAEFALNIDNQKYSEQELDRALQSAKESDRLKNAFVANMSSDIRPALDELVVLSNRLIETNDDSEKELLMNRIEQNNDVLLKYVERIIELSRTDVTKNISL